MRFPVFILFLGICLPHWTTGDSVECRGGLSIIENGVLKKAVSANQTHVDLSFCEIVWIEDNAFDDLTNVTNLNLSFNELHTLEFWFFSKLENLEELSLRGNKIHSLGGVFFGLNNLKYLDISSNPIYQLKKQYLLGLSNSTIIYFGANLRFNKTASSLGEKHDDIKLCKTVDGSVEIIAQFENSNVLGACITVELDRRLGGIDLSKLGLKKFEKKWYRLLENSITTLILSENEITDITPDLFNDLSDSIDFVDLTYNDIDTISKNIINNEHIKSMYFDNNFISTIEDGAFEKTNLTVLSVKENRLNDLAFVKTLPPTLKELILSGNSFPVISANTFKGLKKLEIISLNTCRIGIIEQGAFEDLENLSTLRLDNNRIRQLKPGVFRGLKNLGEIDLSSNRIEKITQGVFSEFENSTTLLIGLQDNQIDSIEAGSFAHLRIHVLELGSNKITEKSFEKGAFNTTSVMTLLLNDNLISEINESVTKIPVYESLDLKRNKLTSIEKGAFEEMSHVNRIDLGGNPLNRLENGAFRGLSSDTVTINIKQVPIEIIEAGVFGEN